MVLNFEQIKKLLPQRFPFLLLDKIIDYEPNKRIKGIKNITGNDIFFQGHFPKEAIMPGALIIEAMAQVSIIFFKLSQANNKQKHSLFCFCWQFQQQENCIHKPIPKLIPALYAPLVEIHNSLRGPILTTMDWRI